MFGACERRCVDVSIVEDEILEGTELFQYTLERTPGLDSSIELNRVLGQVEIIDNDGVYDFKHLNTLQLSVIIPSFRGCGGSGEDFLPGLRGCGCARSVCYCVQS